jgi:site-specific DNA-methyltransferase (adenine-specific)
MAVNIEDAGFEIRDMIAWVYGSGFPKSHNISKALDKVTGTQAQGFSQSGNDGRKAELKQDKSFRSDYGYRFTPKTEEAKQWEGWGTALKPALEPITMARKPFKGTVANNVLKNGVGGINIDGCRVNAGEEITNRISKTGIKENGDNLHKMGMKESIYKGSKQGRFPANFIHDGSNEVTDLFPYTSGAGNKIGTPKKSGTFFTDEQTRTNFKYDCGGSASRFFYCAKASKQDRNEGLKDFEEKDCGRNTTRRCVNCNKSIVGLSQKQEDKCICSNRVEIQTKNKNNHPTVKPTDLMRYLVRLVTPKNGIVLDCFMGSGSTGKACALEGFEFVGIDLDKDYCEIAKARIDKAIEDKKQAEAQQELF